MELASHSFQPYYTIRGPDFHTPSPPRQYVEPLSPETLRKRKFEEFQTDEDCKERLARAPDTRVADAELLLGFALSQHQSTKQARIKEGDSKPDMKRVTDNCVVCSTSGSPTWITCNECKSWLHTSCAGFKNEREVRNIDKFYCPACCALGWEITYVRKSSRAHLAVDYAGLNEGKIVTDSVEHHYIQPIKDGTLDIQPESFPRLRPEFATKEVFERTGMTEPVLIPAEWNSESFLEDFDYECVPDDGQDRLDMVMPRNLTVRRVAQLVGEDERVEVIDVKSQEGGDNRWNLAKWADYYEATGEKPVRNVISLEVSQNRLGKLVRRPKVVRDLDLQDSVWPRDELDRGNYPQVQFYCLMSVKDCYTDFHIDFGGSSVFYHILQGKKTFFFIPPKKQHLKAYEKWCLSSNQSSTFLGNITKECYRVDLEEGDTMLIPSGWIHAVWTPENSLVIGGNFLTRLHIGMQIQVNEIEKITGVGRRFRYPHFQKVLWYTVIQYLEEDPIPSTILELLHQGTTVLAQGSYSQAELDGLPDLLRFIQRTVMISTGKITVNKSTQEAVSRSMPKGYGSHVDTLKIFAAWVAWQRGELMPDWALEPSSPSTDQESYRIACANCRRRRIRCKHKPDDSTRTFGTSDHPATAISLTPNKAKACEECRRSKVRQRYLTQLIQRRCIHDENGDLDHEKASQEPVPRVYSIKAQSSPREAEVDRPSSMSSGAATSPEGPHTPLDFHGVGDAMFVDHRNPDDLRLARVLQEQEFGLRQRK